MVSRPIEDTYEWRSWALNKQTIKYNEHYRSISLCNFTYKIVSKLLTSRIGVFLDRLISHYQGAFVQGRWIAENSIIAEELMHKIRQHKGKNGLTFIKIDLSKAYDRLEWPFLELVLHEWGFSDQVRRLIMSCVSTVRYNLLLNGSLCKDFTPTRGVRQGDLLSPYLFILCAEILS